MKITIKRGFQPPVCFESSKTAPLASQVLKDAGFMIDLPCAGRGICKKCRIQAVGILSEPTPEEKNAFLPNELKAGARLACQTRLLGDAALSLEDTGESVILCDGYLPPFTVNPLGDDLGIAVDIGTTTLALYLAELSTGKILARTSRKNPQSVFGGDVISRIEKAMSGEGAALQNAVIAAIDEMILEACRLAQTKASRITAGVLAGNTAMLYLLCGENPASLAAAPFQAGDLFGRTLSAKALGLTAIGSTAAVYLPRCIGAYLGADITAALVSSQLEKESGAAILLDLGTNGEMILKTDTGLYGCSTAAGPAFEGVGLYQGMQALPGAVDSVWWQGGRLAYTVIGDIAPKGICGSGMISLTSAFLESGIIDGTGRIQTDHPYAAAHLKTVDGLPAVEIESSGVLVTQKDIRSIQLAKAAVCAGILTLLNEAALNPSQLSGVLLAGGFGNYINVSCGEKMGLFPEGLAAITRPTGNSSGMGAFLLLEDKSFLADSERLAESVQEIDLSSNAFFQEAYVDCMLFNE